MNGFGVEVGAAALQAVGCFSAPGKLTYVIHKAVGEVGIKSDEATVPLGRQTCEIGGLAELDGSSFFMVTSGMGLPLLSPDPKAGMSTEPISSVPGTKASST